MARTARRQDAAALVRNRASAWGWIVSEDQASKLLGHLEAVIETSRQLNLTAVKDIDEGIARHVLDSLAFGLHVRERPAPASPVWLDLGTGGGFPGVPAAVVAPEATVHLVESRGRKLDAVRRIAEGLGVRNLRFHHARLEDLVRREPSLAGGCDLVFARGIGPLAEIVAASAPALRPGSGTLLCWKSATLESAERQAGEAKARFLGLVALPDLPYESFKPCLLVRYRRESPGHVS